MSSTLSMCILSMSRHFPYRNLKAIAALGWFPLIHVRIYISQTEMRVTTSLPSDEQTMMNNCISRGVMWHQYFLSEYSWFFSTLLGEESMWSTRHAPFLQMSSPARSANPTKSNIPAWTPFDGECQGEWVAVVSFACILSWWYIRPIMVIFTWTGSPRSLSTKLSRSQRYKGQQRISH